MNGCANSKELQPSAPASSPEKDFSRKLQGQEAAVGRPHGSGLEAREALWRRPPHPAAQDAEWSSSGYERDKPATQHGDRYERRLETPEPAPQDVE